MLISRIISRICEASKSLLIILKWNENFFFSKVGAKFGPQFLWKMSFFFQFVISWLVFLEWRVRVGRTLGFGIFEFAPTVLAPLASVDLLDSRALVSFWFVQSWTVCTLYRGQSRCQGFQIQIISSYSKRKIFHRNTQWEAERFFCFVVADGTNLSMELRGGNRSSWTNVCVKLVELS